jgi:hypothetical protein
MDLAAALERLQAGAAKDADRKNRAMNQQRKMAGKEVK